MKTKVIVVILVCLWAVGNSLAADWYLDNAASGANNGTSWNNAWQDASDVVWGAAGVNAGDTLWISGGTTSKTYTIGVNSWLSVGASGTSHVNRITVRIGQTAGHNGIAVFDLQHLYKNAFQSYAKNYVTFDGEYNGARHFHITNGLTLGATNGDSGATLARFYGGSGTGKYLIVKGIEAEHCDNGFSIGENTDPDGEGPEVGIEISNFYLHNIMWETGISANFSVAANTHFDCHKIHDGIISVNYLATGAPDGIQGGNGLSIYNVVFEVNNSSPAISGVRFESGKNAPPVGATLNGETSGATGTVVGSRE